MSDLQAYIRNRNRKQSAPEFDANYETEYVQFKIGVMLNLLGKMPD